MELKFVLVEIVLVETVLVGDSLYIVKNKCNLFYFWNYLVYDDLVQGYSSGGVVVSSFLIYQSLTYFLYSSLGITRVAGQACSLWWQRR